MLELKCRECGKIFKIYPSQLKNKEPKYCSIECYRKNQKRNINEYILKNNYYILKIFNKFNKRIVEVLISVDNYNEVKEYNWCACWDNTIKNYYIRGGKNREKVQLHRLITKCPPNMQVDHINHNTLDNRKENLRIVTNKENAQNKKKCGLPNKFGEKGISYHIQRKKYCFIWKAKHIGIFNTLQEAIDFKYKWLKESEEIDE